MSCKHKSTREKLRPDFGTFARICNACGAWLSLGPSNDDGEHAARVAIELRAAELAGHHFTLLIGCEECGWDAGEDDECDHDRDCRSAWPERTEFDAGFLGRRIADHDEDVSTESPVTTTITNESGVMTWTDSPDGDEGGGV